MFAPDRTYRRAPAKFRDADFIQLLVARHYEPRYGNGFVSFGNFPAFDVKFSNGVTLEIKFDSKASETGNACIEFWDQRRDKPSGILATTATLWVHIVPFEAEVSCFEVDTKRLLSLCLQLPSFTSGGDNCSSLLKLVPLLKLKAICSQVFRLEGA